MTSQHGSHTAGLSQAAGIEAQLADKLRQAEDEIAHMESLDTEQRSEIYTILQALMADSQVHQQLVGQWVNDQTGGTHHV